MENITKFSEDIGIASYKLITIDRCFCTLFVFKSICLVIKFYEYFFYYSIVNSIYFLM